MARFRQKGEFLDFVYDLHKGMKEHEITLAYEGEINHKIMKTFTSMAEEKMSKYDESEVIRKKVYHVMVECLQNISKHALQPEDEAYKESNHGIFLISRNYYVYNVTTGNVIHNDQIPHLTDLLIHVNSLSINRLNERHKKQLREGHLSEKGGAGLGFIDIRRKTGMKLEYRFIPLSDSHSFFLFTSTIPRKI
jgi:hypothetical protein